ncbi:MAG: hypothetical protein AAB592_03325 [Patescibacteria group bacterium]
MNKMCDKKQDDYLKRCKASSPESKLDWLASALEFAQAKKRVLKGTK